MTRRKPLSKRITILSIARNLTQKQEHQLVAMADRARKMESEIETLRAREARVRALLVTPGAIMYSRLGPPYNPVVSAEALEYALDPQEDRFEQELVEAMKKPLGTPAEQAALSLRTERAINQMGSDLRAQEDAS